MASPASSLYSSYYQPTYSGSTVGYNPTTNPTAEAQNQRATVTSQGDQYQATDEDLANEYNAQQGGTQNYLNPLQEANASGQGGYTPAEAAQIQLTPQQQQNITTSAGISAGAGTAAAVGAADRAYAASGGNPAAMAEYRARAAQSQAANAGQAQTGASVAAQQAGSAGAQAVGNASLAEQNQALGYFGNLQSQQGQQGQAEQGLAQGAYGTQVTGTGNAVNSGISAAQLPTTTDKTIGTLAGIATGAAAGGLADGYYPHMADGGTGMDAVVGEDGPEAIVKAASDPVRSDTDFMADGYYPMMANGFNPQDSGEAPVTNGLPNLPGSSTTQQGDDTQPAWKSILSNYLANSSKPAAPVRQPQQWNKTTPYNQAGQAAGAWLGKLSRPAAPAAGGSAPSTGSPSASSSIQTPGDINAEANSAAVDPSAFGGLEGGFAADGYYPHMADGGAGAAMPSSPGSSLTVNDNINTGSTQPWWTQLATNAGTSLLNEVLADGRPHLADGGHLGGAFHWSEPRPRAPHVPAGGYTPLDYRARPMLADGRLAPSEPPPAAADTPSQQYMDDLKSFRSLTTPPSAPPTGKIPSAPPASPPLPAHMTADGYRARPAPMAPGTQIVTKPTRVRLGPEDAVVPLTYRPRAKVRPSAAMAGGLR